MTISTHPLFRSEEEYRQHIAAQIAEERLAPPKPPKTIPDIEYYDDMPVHIYPLNGDPNESMLREWTDEEIRRDTPGVIEKDFSFFKKSWQNIAKSKARQAERFAARAKKYPEIS